MKNAAFYAPNITKPILERYRSHLHHWRQPNGKPLSARTICGRLIPIRSFFRWLTRQNYLLYNPASELELPRLGKRLPQQTLTIEEAEQVLKQPDISDAEGLRDRAILEVFYSTGIRRMELLNLKTEDIDSNRGVLAVRHGKGNKDRFVPIGDRALDWVNKYLQDVRPGFTLPSDQRFVFIDRQGQALRPEWISRRVRFYVEKANVGRAGSCHLFRHTVATLMLEAGADIRFIQQMLGHAQLVSTEIYTHVSILKLKEVHSLTHPAKWPDKARSVLQDDTPTKSTEAAEEEEGELC